MRDLSRVWLRFAAGLGFMAVGLGAFGAHALNGSLDADALSIWHTAVEYHFWHALALLAVAVLARQCASPPLAAAGACFAIGVSIFSGSLYALALGAPRALGALTPIGGLLLLVGWLCLLIAAGAGVPRDPR